MKKIVLILAITIFISLMFVSFIPAHSDEDFSRAEEIIAKKISCKELSNDDLEILGDYYMEQMHPGEAHELMHKMMGGEDSESVKQMHLNMGKSIYCGETTEMMSGGMMEMMGSNMMGNSGMMGNNLNTGYKNTFDQISFWIIRLLTVVVLILLIIWLSKQIQKSDKKNEK